MNPFEMAKKQLEKGLSDPSELKKLMPGDSSQKGASEDMEEKAKGLIKGLKFGQ